MNGEMINFSSENFCGVHDLVMDSLIEANMFNIPSYGRDPYTHAAIERCRSVMS